MVKEETKKEVAVITDEEITEVLVATSIVLKGLAKKVMLRALVNEEKEGGATHGKNERPVD